MYSPLQRTEIALLSPAAKLAGHLFELLDADGSGALDEEEGRTYLLSAGCVPAELDFYWRDLLRVSDGNDGGLVSKEEFLRYTFNDVELTEAGKFHDDGFSKDLRSQIASLGSAGAPTTITRPAPISWAATSASNPMGPEPWITTVSPARKPPTVTARFRARMQQASGSVRLPAIGDSPSGNR